MDRRRNKIEKMEGSNKLYSQLDLWNKLNEENTLQEVQQYIKDVIEIRGFSNQEIEKMSNGIVIGCSIVLVIIVSFSMIKIIKYSRKNNKK